MAGCFPSNDLPGTHYIFPTVIWYSVFIQPLFTYSRTQKMCRTPKNRSEILKLSVRSRPGKSGSWARVQFSTENFAQLLGMRITDSASRLPFRWWIPVEYIPAAILSTCSSSPLPQTPLVHHGSLVDLLDSINPDLQVSQARGSVDSVPRTVQRFPDPFPQSFFKLTETPTDPPAHVSPTSNSFTVPRKRKRDNSEVGSSSQLDTISSRRKGKQQQTEPPALIDTDVIVLSDDSASDPEVKLIGSDPSASVEVIEISD